MASPRIDLEHASPAVRRAVDSRAGETSKLIPEGRRSQPSASRALSRCGSRSEREGQGTAQRGRSLGERDQEAQTNMLDGRDEEDVGRRGGAGRYICCSKAARGRAKAPCPIGGAPNPAGQTPAK